MAHDRICVAGDILARATEHSMEVLRYYNIKLMRALSR